jgi:hypothetical protein
MSLSFVEYQCECPVCGERFVAQVSFNGNPGPPAVAPILMRCPRHIANLCERCWESGGREAGKKTPFGYLCAAHSRKARELHV